MPELADMLGERIRAIRRKMKLSRAEFAHIVEMSEDAIGLIERGETVPRLESLYKISLNLKIPLAKLLEFSGNIIKEDTPSARKRLNALNLYLNTKSPEQINMIHDMARTVLDKKHSGYSAGRSKKRNLHSFITRDK